MYKSYSELGTNPDQNLDQYSVLEIQNSQMLSSLITSTKFVCVDIYADWCGPCKTFSPIFGGFAKKYANEAKLVKYNFDRMEAEEKKDIQTIPVFLFFYDGKLVNKVVGANSENVESLLKTYTEKVRKERMSGPSYMRNALRN